MCRTTSAEVFLDLPSTSKNQILNLLAPISPAGLRGEKAPKGRVVGARNETEPGGLPALSWCWLLEG